jgi:hypothetical protein
LGLLCLGIVALAVFYWVIPFFIQQVFPLNHLYLPQLVA